MVRLTFSSSMGSVAGIDLVKSPKSWLVRSVDATHAGTGATYDAHVRVWVRVETIGSRQLISYAHQSETTVGGVAVNNALVAPTEPEAWTLLGPLGTSEASDLETDLGLLVSLTASNPVVAVVDGTATFDWYWSLPNCAVEVTRAAGVKRESHECSGRGRCDRKTGLCECFAGYEGGVCGEQSIVV
jgi:EGF-like domain